ncbi:putative GTPase [Saccharomycopsis crataegensis]|uniref:GTPase n=1 Tax=Saccharomycopsis crataegensis TaxID=43959 RepID=A0AAV5QH77_9ASCO|nr:putative GTPase [Saccharomycopsis crataegensis]
MPPQKEPPKKWKAPKGPKPVHHKQRNTIGLGKAIIYQRTKENNIEILPDGESRFATDKKEDDWVKLRSITQENHIDDFLNSAELANKDFTAVKRNQMTILGTSSVGTNYLLSEEREKEVSLEILKNQNKLVVPRRPEWTKDMSKFLLQEREKKAFLEWRRELAVLQKNNDLLLTPFERNLEVWRQLWRVIERSDLVVQIVDARNPLAFRSIDLEHYVKELDDRKKNLLLVNKADLLSLNQRKAWAEYFIKNDVPYAFFSAGRANEILEKEKEELENIRLGLSTPAQAKNNYDDGDDDEEEQEKKVFNTQSEDLEEKVRILTIDELEDLFISEAPEPLTLPLSAGEKPKLQIGLVGYPNVGKSSTINALVGAKKVSVSSTPGKTKHFQTILLSDDIILCDCPGLVFPNFAHTNAELVCNGVLPIDQLRESIGPTQLVARRIPKFFLEAIYGISIQTKSEEDGGDGIPTAQELLTSYARARGFMTQGFGSADESRAARYVLKDYVNGKLLFVHPPPNADGTIKTYDERLSFNKELYTIDLLSENRRKQIIQAINASDNFDLETFDLAKDLSKISFSSHIAGINNEQSTGSYHGGSQAALVSASDELNREFFKSNGIKGIQTTVFHNKKNEFSNNKKHKKGKKLKVRNVK